MAALLGGGTDQMDLHLPLQITVRQFKTEIAKKLVSGAGEFVAQVLAYFSQAYWARYAI